MPSNDQEALTALLDRFRSSLSRPSSNVDESVIFASPGIPIDKETLKAAESPLSDPRKDADFAYLANAIPPEEGLWSFRAEFIWHIYERILNEARLARSNLSPDEEELLSNSRALLADEQGNWTSFYINYMKKEDKFFAAEAAYMENALQMRSASDDADKLLRLQLQDRTLKQALERARRALVAAGKNRVDAALSNIDRLASKNPALFFGKLSESLRNAERLDLSGGKYYDTGTLPLDFSNEELGWTNFSVSDSDLNFTNLNSSNSTAEVGSGLWSLYPDSALARSGVGIQLASETKKFSLSLEFRRFPIRRNWLDPLLFNSRSWRLPDDETLVSDGKVPPKGIMTSYVTELILVKNLVLTIDTNVEPSRWILEFGNHIPSLAWGPFRLRGGSISEELLASSDIQTRLDQVRSNPDHMNWLFTNPHERMSAGSESETIQPNPTAELDLEEIMAALRNATDDIERRRFRSDPDETAMVEATLEDIGVNAELGSPEIGNHLDTLRVMESAMRIGGDQASIDADTLNELVNTLSSHYRTGLSAGAIIGPSLGIDGSEGGISGQPTLGRTTLPWDPIVPIGGSPIPGRPRIWPQPVPIPEPSPVPLPEPPQIDFPFPRPPLDSLPVLPQPEHNFDSTKNEIKVNGMQIIGFVCRKLPRSPNPDDELDWFEN